MTSLPETTDFATLLPTPARTPRHDGWTPDRQRQFLERIANGATVERACGAVGLAVSSAYAFRQRAAGQGFALGWKAATLLSRDRGADELMTRAMDGITDTVTRADGSIWSRHRHDNRTALALLHRLDRMAEQAPADPAAAAQSHAARLVAQEFDAFLDLIAQDRGPSHAGLFLARRIGIEDAPAAAPELEPVLTLARADAFHRTGAALPEEVDVRDLDLAARAGWSADQWRRAEAAGLLRLAPAPGEADAPEAEATGETPPLPPLPPLVRVFDPVWWDEEARAFRTHFPPPPEADDALDVAGRFGEECYERSLTDEEEEVMAAADAADLDGERAEAEDARHRWFAALRARIAAAAAQADAPCPAEEDDPARPHALH